MINKTYVYEKMDFDVMGWSLYRWFDGTNPY